MRPLTSFLRGALGTGLAVGARAAGALALNKLLALYGGPGALTQLAQFQNLMGLFGALPTEGVAVGATARLAPLRPGTARHGLWLRAAAWLTGGLVLGAGALLAGLGGAAWPPGRVALFTLAMLAVGWQGLLSAALLAAGRRRAYVGLAVGLSGLGVGAVAAGLALGQPLGRVLLAYALGQALTLGPALGLAARAGLLRGAWPLRRPPPAAVRGLGRFLLMALGALLAGRAVDYGLRAYLVAHFPPAATDQWQAVAKLSDLAALALGALLSTVYLPRLAALAPQPAAQRRYVGAVAAGLAGALALGLAGLWAGRGLVLSALFAPRLAAAAPLLAPQLLGDWARFLGWVFEYTLLVRARPGPYLAVQFGTAALYVAMLALRLPARGLPGAVEAYALAHGLVLLGLLGWFVGVGLAPARR